MPNAWDAGSARMLAGSGFTAIGTTSAGIAFAAGLPDHQNLDRDAMLATVQTIVNAVDVPVSADLEGGFGTRPDRVAETVQMAIAIGVVGCNIEDLSGDIADPLLDAQLAAERIQAARAAANASGFAFTLTARTDAFLTNHPHPLDEAIRRANLYRAAGADCLFVPGVDNLEIIQHLVRSIDGPLNIVMGLGKNNLSVAELKNCGVRRISIGGSLARACFYLIQQAGLEILRSGTFSYAEKQIPHKELCDFFAEVENRMRAQGLEAGITLEERKTEKGNIALLNDAGRTIIDGNAFLEVIFSTSTRTIVLTKSNFPDAFFELKSGLAGEILQKVTNYRVRVIILGDFSAYTSRAFLDFMYECNKNGTVIFASDLEGGIALLK